MNTQIFTSINKCIIRNVVITVLLALSTLLMILSVPNQYLARSESYPTIVVDSKTMHIGQTFEIAVNLIDNTGLEAIVLQLDYDENAFTLMNVERGNALRTLSFTTTNVNTNLGYSIRPFKMLWDGRAPDSSTGTMVVFTFNASRNAEKKGYNITISYEEKNTKSSYGVKVPVDISGGEVTLIGGLYTVNYIDYNGISLQTTEYNEQAIPTYTGSAPVRQENDAYKYIFNGWVPSASENASLLTFKADYIAIPKIYNLKYFLDGQLYEERQCAYGEDISRLSVDDRQYYDFSGWHLDNRYKNRISIGMTMPAHDIILYGKYVFNTRMDEIDIPVIEMIASDDNGLVKIDVVLVINTGISGMILTLDYDYVYMDLVNVERGEGLALLQYDTTNSVNGYDEMPYRLYWEGIQNDYSTGIIATLYFRLANDIEDGLYNVSMTYNSSQDISYLEEGNLIYSDIVIQAAILIVEDGLAQWDTDGLDTKNIVWLIIIIILTILLFISLTFNIYLYIKKRKR